MKQFIVITCLILGTAAAAEEEANEKSLMQQGAELFLRGLTEQMEPALKDLQQLTEEMGPEMLEFFSSMGPAMRDLLEEVDDWSRYERPEVLPNGDIIIRRKPELGPDSDTTEKKGPVDL
jgi:hypothetical protein